MSKTSEGLKSMYDTFYSDSTEEWRKIGALGKAENILDVTKGLTINKVVEVGAGDGNIISLLSDNKFCSDFTAVEISESAIEQIKKKKIAGLTNVVKFDGYHLPFEDNQFDLAICSHVMEHVEHPRLLLREIKRISKHQCFEIPIDFSFNVDKQFKHFNDYGHINIFTPALFNFLLLSEGFEIVNNKHSLYSKKVIDFQNKSFSMKYLSTMIKRTIWKTLPMLMRIKPNSYTVLTK